MKPSVKQDIRDGLRDAVPIAIGYFAVAIALGITARQAGITPFQGFVSSFLNRTSTGEFAGYRLVLEQAPYLAMFVMTLIVNARYVLMSAALSQRIPEGTPLWHRCIMAFGITDEIFGATILRGKPVSVWYSFFIATPAALGWAAGDATGILMGNVLPERIVLALGVALYGMFIAVFVPPARKSRIIAGLVLVSFALSWVFTKVAPLSHLSSGNRIILLTVVIAGVASVLFPVKDEDTQLAESEVAPDA
ncbi:MAG: AzlC family ABC transporter permease [Clostridia bacterium]|nr:AzlC family ABC transporter permease [Clostridia bacterium]